jgi:hypothetical protein
MYGDDFVAFIESEIEAFGAESTDHVWRTRHLANRRSRLAEAPSQWTCGRVCTAAGGLRASNRGQARQLSAQALDARAE